MKVCGRLWNLDVLNFQVYERWGVCVRVRVCVCVYVWPGGRCNWPWSFCCRRRRAPDSVSSVADIEGQPTFVFLLQILKGNWPWSFCCRRSSCPAVQLHWANPAAGPCSVSEVQCCRQPHSADLLDAGQVSASKQRQVQYELASRDRGRTAATPTVGPTSKSCNGHPIAWAGHPTSFNAQVKKEWRFSSTPSVHLQTSDTFTFIHEFQSLAIHLYRPVSTLSKRCKWAFAVGILRYCNTLEEQKFVSP